MESLVLRRRLLRFLLLGSIAAIGLLVKLTVSHVEEVSRHNRSCPHGNECYKGPAVRYVHPTADEMQTYTRVAEEIVKAYSNGQVSVMQEWAGRFPKEAYRLRGDDLVKVIQPVSKLWFRECVRIGRLVFFATPEEFERQMGMRLALSKLYGNFIVDSGETADDVLVTLDITILNQLQGCRTKFEKEGKSEYLPAVERLMEDWIGQIESEKGFTREYARSQKNGLRRLVEKGELTEDGLIAHARIYPLLLQERCGYTPKWLDEEFPLLLEEKESKGTEASTNAGR